MNSYDDSQASKKIGRKVENSLLNATTNYGRGYFGSAVIVDLEQQKQQHDDDVVLSWVSPQSSFAIGTKRSRLFKLKRTKPQTTVAAKALD